MPDPEASPSLGNRRRARERETEPVVRPGRPTGDIKAKRAELLAAAISVIAQEGYAGASLRKVAQRAGCTTGAVSYYFVNKEEMFTAVAQNLFDQFETTVDTLQEQFDITALVGQWQEWVNEPNAWLAWLQLLSHAKQEPVFADIIKQRYTRFLQVFASVLEEGQLQGKVRNDIPAAVLADQVSAISDGWLMMMPLDPQRFSAGRGQAQLDALIAMITPH